MRRSFLKVCPLRRNLWGAFYVDGSVLSWWKTYWKHYYQGSIQLISIKWISCRRLETFMNSNSNMAAFYKDYVKQCRKDGEGPVKNRDNLSPCRMEWRTSLLHW